MKYPRYIGISPTCTCCEVRNSNIFPTHQFSPDHIHNSWAKSALNISVQNINLQSAGKSFGHIFLTFRKWDRWFCTLGLPSKRSGSMDFDTRKPLANTSLDSNPEKRTTTTTTIQICWSNIALRCRSATECHRVSKSESVEVLLSHNLQALFCPVMLYPLEFCIRQMENWKKKNSTHRTERKVRHWKHWNIVKHSNNGAKHSKSCMVSSIHLTRLISVSCICKYWILIRNNDFVVSAFLLHYLKFCWQFTKYAKYNPFLSVEHVRMRKKNKHRVCSIFRQNPIESSLLSPNVSWHSINSSDRKINYSTSSRIMGDGKR